MALYVLRDEWPYEALYVLRDEWPYGALCVLWDEWRFMSYGTSGALCPMGQVALRGVLMSKSTCHGCNLYKLGENSSETECVRGEFF